VGEGLARACVEEDRVAVAVGPVEQAAQDLREREEKGWGMGGSLSGGREGEWGRSGRGGRAPRAALVQLRRAGGVGRGRAGEREARAGGAGR
jgi:hypothetical protein